MQIPAGAATATVTGTPIDGGRGNDETVTVMLGASAAYRWRGGAHRDDPKRRGDHAADGTIAATDATATEAGPMTGRYTVTHRRDDRGADGDLHDRGRRARERLSGLSPERADLGGRRDGDGDRHADDARSRPTRRPVAISVSERGIVVGPAAGAIVTIRATTPRRWRP
jgi:hypothetical protein